MRSLFFTVLAASVILWPSWGISQTTGTRPTAEGPKKPLIFSTYDITGQQVVTFSGMTDPFSRLIVQGGRETSFARANERGFFKVRVKLNTNEKNTLWFFAYDTDNNASVPGKVEIEQDSTAPEAPNLDAVVESTEDEQIEVSGTAEPGSTILVRGGAYEVWKLTNEEGKFILDVPLQLGKVNQLMFKAVDTAFNSSSVVTAKVKQLGSEKTSNFSVEVERPLEP